MITHHTVRSLREKLASLSESAGADRYSAAKDAAALVFRGMSAPATRKDLFAAIALRVSKNTAIMDFLASRLKQNGGDYARLSYEPVKDVLGTAIYDWSVGELGNPKAVRSRYGDEPISGDSELAQLLHKYAAKHTVGPVGPTKGSAVDWSEFDKLMGMLADHKDMGKHHSSEDIAQLKKILSRLLKMVS